MWLSLSLCWGGIQIQHPQTLLKRLVAVFPLSHSCGWGVTIWFGVTRCCVCFSVAAKSFLPCPVSGWWATYLSVCRVRSAWICLHALVQDVLTWLSRECSLAPNHPETCLYGLDSTVSLCRLQFARPQHLSVRGKWEPLLQKGSVGIQSPPRVFNFGEKRTGKPVLAECSWEQLLVPYIMYLFSLNHSDKVLLKCNVLFIVFLMKMSWGEILFSSWGLCRFSQWQQGIKKKKKKRQAWPNPVSYSRLLKAKRREWEGDGKDGIGRIFGLSFQIVFCGMVFPLILRIARILPKTTKKAKTGRE